MKTRLAIAIFCITILALAMPGAQAQIETEPDCALPENAFAYDKYLELGDEARAQKDYAQAVNYYTCAVQIKPNEADPYKRRGKVYLDNLKNYEKAVEDYTLLAGITPDDPAAHNNRGWAYFNIGEYHMAISSYDRAIQADPNYALAYNNRGVANNYLQRPLEAIADFTTAIRLEMEPLTWPYTNLGIAYAGYGRLDEAIRSYQKAIEIDPDFAEAYKWLGEAYHTMQRVDDSLANYNRYVELQQRAGLPVDSEVLNLINSMRSPSDVSRMLPILLIVVIIGAALAAGIWPVIRRRRGAPSRPLTQPLPTASPSPSAQPPQAETNAAETPSRDRSKLIIIPIVTLAVGALAFAIRRIGQDNVDEG